MSNPPAATGSLKSREIVLAVCGGIAAYKVADLTSKLVQAGAQVTVVMTPDATKFVTPLTFEALSGRKVLSDPWTLPDSPDPHPISPPQKADLLVLAPPTAPTLPQAAHALCD